jgi:hypothetical protein
MFYVLYQFVTHLLTFPRIQEVPGSNLDRGTDYSVEILL